MLQNFLKTNTFFLYLWLLLKNIPKTIASAPSQPHDLMIPSKTNDGSPIRNVLSLPLVPIAAILWF
jgi:hypothetical protein